MERGRETCPCKFHAGAGEGTSSPSTNPAPCPAVAETSGIGAAAGVTRCRYAVNSNSYCLSAEGFPDMGVGGVESAITINP